MYISLSLYIYIYIHTYTHINALYINILYRTILYNVMRSALQATHGFCAAPTSRAPEDKLKKASFHFTVPQRAIRKGSSGEIITFE